MSSAFVPTASQKDWSGAARDERRQRPAGDLKKPNLPGDRNWVRRCYDGPAGWMLRVGSLLSLHEQLVGRLITGGGFDVRGCRSILDVGAGAGQILRHLLSSMDPGANVTAIDLSTGMLQRTRRRLQNERPVLLAADLTRLPFSDASFDCVTCGWVLEYQQDPTPALREIRRVLIPGGKLLVLATDDTPAGRLVGRLWSCRTFTTPALRTACRDAGLTWRRRHWLSPVHRFLGAGGILFEVTRPRLEAPHSRDAARSRSPG